MVNKFLLGCLCFFALPAMAQLKTDVVIFGGSASGTAAAIQTARSGVKAILIEPNDYLISNIAPSMDIKAFNTGIWAEWKRKHEASKNKDPRLVIKSIADTVKRLTVYMKTPVLKITKKGKGFEVTANINGQVIEIKTKVLIDGTDNPENSPLAKAKIINFNNNGKIKGMVVYSPAQQQKPYEQLQKLIQTAVAAGYAADTTKLHFIPVGALLPQGVDNVIVVSPQFSSSGFSTDDLQNTALRVSIGQASGGLAAYGPFFETTPAKANLRIIQGEVFNFKGQILPLTDVNKTDASFQLIQKVIASSLLKIDMQNGKFYPDSSVKAAEINKVMAQLFPRSRIWFIEEKVNELTIANTISLISFISAKEVTPLSKELQQRWKSKYQFTSPFKPDAKISRKEFAVIMQEYLSVFSVTVDFNGYYLR